MWMVNDDFLSWPPEPVLDLQKEKKKKKGYLAKLNNIATILDCFIDASTVQHDFSYNALGMQ